MASGVYVRISFCATWKVHVCAQVLNMLLHDWQEERSNEVLIFTKSVKVLKMLEFHLNSNSEFLLGQHVVLIRFIGYGWVKLDGSVDPKDCKLFLVALSKYIRFLFIGMAVIDKFHEDPDVCVFLSSTMAGGTRLNLMGANKAVIFGRSG